MSNNTYITIMAGGIGSRFWPASTAEHPKQFLDILGIGKSLLQMTYERFLPLTTPAHVLILTNERYKQLIAKQLPDVPEENILCEPSMNNTAPAIAYAALRLKAMDPDGVFVVAPSDHVILKEERFRQKIQQALNYAAGQNALLTLGIRPTRPATGYGYIERGNEVKADIYSVLRFVEKPDKETAMAYLSAQRYLWNAGIFIWSVQSILSAFRKFSPGILETLETDIYNTVAESEFIKKHYPQTEKISIDYAILERADNVFTIPADIGWSDLGTWNALYEFSDKDKSHNALFAEKVWLKDSRENLIRLPKGKQLVAKGLQGMIVVDEGDTLLIYPREDEQEIKKVRKEVMGD